MRRATTISVVVYGIRGNVSRRIIWHLVTMGLRCEICRMEGPSLGFLLCICPQTAVQTNNLVLMWSRGALHSFCIWCILFEVERGFLPDELLFLFAFLCQNAWCGTLVVELGLPFALMWWVAFCLQDQLHPFCYSVVMTLFSSLALNWLVLRGTGHDAWLSSMACFRLIFRAWCRQKISTQKPSMVTCFFFPGGPAKIFLDLPTTRNFWLFRLLPTNLVIG